MRICLISSGNGGAFKAFVRLAAIPAANILIITDRPCGIETFAADHAIAHSRLAIADNEAFSSAARRAIDQFGGADCVFLLFTRLVTRSLFAHYATINFHPSLLPAFQGFQPIRRALQKQVKFVGTTMHLVDDSVDDGKILAQATHPITGDESESGLEDIAFLHKVYFMLLVAENFESDRTMRLDFAGWPHAAGFNPSLRSAKYQDLYAALVKAQSQRTEDS